jgi:hypothetical protein
MVVRLDFPDKDKEIKQKYVTSTLRATVSSVRYSIDAVTRRRNGHLRSSPTTNPCRLAEAPYVSDHRSHHKIPKL